MDKKNSIFEKTYDYYKAQMAAIDLSSVGEVLGVETEGEKTIIPLFNKPFYVSRHGITDSSGVRPSFESCVVLFKYLIHPKGVPPENREWKAYRDFKDSGPLLSFFRSDAEDPIARYFSGRIEELKSTCIGLSGNPIDMGDSYNVAFELRALPMVPVLLLFNDRDEEFPSDCSVLFRGDADYFLDAECLAILGSLLFKYLLSYS